jgi:hypothetical protein
VVREKFLTAMLLAFFLLIPFVTFSLVEIKVFSVNALAAVLILIVGFDTFAFWGTISE